MLVKCDQCSQSYQVNEARLPPQGARIKCPTCSHIFLVRPPSSVDAEASASLKEEAPKASLEKSVSDKIVSDESTWKIRSTGLTYTFHDMASLREWLSGRTTLKDVKIALDDDPWKELGDYPKVLTTELITKFFPLGDVPKSSQAQGSKESPKKDELPPAPIKAEANAPLSKSADLSVSMASLTTIKAFKKARRDEKRKSRNAHSPLKVAIVSFFCLAAIALLLYTLDVIKLGPKDTQLPANTRIELIDGVEVLAEVVTEEDATALPVPSEAKQQEAKALEAVAPEIVVLSDEEKSAISAANLKKSKDEAKDMIKRSRWTEANVILSSVIEEYPEDIESKELLARSYRKLQMYDEARALETEVRKAKRAKK